MSLRSTLFEFWRRIEILIFDNPLSVLLVEFSKKYSLPGFHGVSLFTLLTFIHQEIRKNDISTRASAMSFHFFLALFPAILFLFTLTAYLPKELDLFNNLEKSLHNILPEDTSKYLWDSIVSGLKPQARGSILSLGFFLAIYFASDGILAMMKGFDKTYRSSFRKRSFLEKQIVAIGITLLLGFLLVLSVVLLILGGIIFKWFFGLLKLGKLAAYSLSLLQYSVVLMLFITVIDMIYRYGPALRKPLGFLSPGTIFATTTSILSSVLFAYFVENFSTYHKVYGAISALVITLLWIRINVLILILGFEINAAILVNRQLPHIKTDQ